MKMGVEEEQMKGPRGSREEKIFVSVRLRPLSEKEIARNEVSDWECINGVRIIDRSHLSISDPPAYIFDRVFGPECCTRQVYEQGAKEVALSVVSGVNVSIFAYGQTSSGKTYTMTGITDYTMADIYDYIEKHKEREFILKFSAMEIYNESVRDLLSTDSTPLRLRDDPEKGTVVEKLTEETLHDLNHFKELLSVCKAQRQIGETALNEVSSRSHQILRLTIESMACEYLTNDKSSTLSATVNFIDLAGSERASQSLSAGTRLKEGSHINRSLLTLGTVIRKLSKEKTGHIPFRDSKMTRILQLSLGGNGRTAIICTMSPAKIHVEQSRNTLLFASCAKEVTTNAQVNVVLSDKALVKRLQKELARLENELRLRSHGRAFVGSYDTSSLLREKDLQIEKLNKKVFELTQQLELTRSQFEEFQRMVGEEKQLAKEISSAESVQFVQRNQYPKLRVRKSWDFENARPESPVSAQPSSLSPHSTERSYDENVFQLSDFRSDSGASGPPQHISFGTPSELTDVQLHIHETETKEQSDVHKEETADRPHNHEEQLIEVNDQQPDRNSEDNCMEVRCIEMEESGISRCPDPNNACALPVLESLRPLTGAEDEEKEQLDGDMSSLGKYPASIEKPYSWVHGRDSQAFEGMKLVRSRSCRSSLMSSSSFSWFEKDEKSSENMPPSWYEKELIRTTEKPTRTIPTLHYNFRDEKPFSNEFGGGLSSWFGKYWNVRRRVRAQTMPGASQYGINNGISSSNQSQAWPSDSSMLELQNYDTRAPDIEEKIVEMENLERMIHRLMEEDVENKTVRSKSDSYTALDPIRDYLEVRQMNWEMEFKKMQREIIELWHMCNVSMGHRTYFFLLFRGDEKDCLYMEVELRRLSHISESFHHGSKAVEQGRTLSPTSSMRALNRERYKLSQLMEKKLTKEERRKLFMRWGIGLNTKHRRLQLAHRLWSETKDMDHVRESATVVGKLLGFVDMDLSSREMFGLNFSLRPRPKKKSSRWKRSVLSLAIF
ncbi:PREDICTED: kinesin-like protein KIN-7H isoform X2 [Tarenaya hassleriana]|uniref:kinesin-like protein KIN-7H isoform X2 n=1 Tax=Tarenaya hassleriana TaxID=28532 RepID=UPI00053C8A19|nr:PREDICTED: kinesin-like protein KIN-7H isoform X2 [Tarenaya hassleriana]